MEKKAAFLAGDAKPRPVDPERLKQLEEKMNTVAGTGDEEEEEEEFKDAEGKNSPCLCSVRLSNVTKEVDDAYDDEDMGDDYNAEGYFNDGEADEDNDDEGGYGDDY